MAMLIYNGVGCSMSFIYDGTPCLARTCDRIVFETRSCFESPYICDAIARATKDLYYVYD